MTGTIVGIVILVVVLIVGPFAALRAVSHYRARRSSSAAPAKPDQDEENPDDKRGFW